MRAGTLGVSVAPVGREIELRRHTDADGDVLTAEGVGAALEIGARLGGEYHLAVSTGAQRATQTLACFLAALGQQVPGGGVVEPGLRFGGRGPLALGVPEGRKRRARGVTRGRP
jgi:broad specificity phosphatase PhoE